MKNPLHERCMACTYCEAPLGRQHEHDHFPIPKSAGGTKAVPVCINCHDLKDRTTLDNWPPSAAFLAFRDLEKTLGFFRPHEIEADRLYDPEWPRLTPMGRVLYAKIIRLRYEYERLEAHRSALASLVAVETPPA